MADEGQVIRGIDWRQTFAFTHIFRSFRIAIHLWKLVLGLCLLLTVYFGGRILDWAWPMRARAVPGEVVEYEQIASGKDQVKLSQWREQARKAMTDDYAAMLKDNDYLVERQGPGETTAAYDARVLQDASDGSYLSDLVDKINAKLDKEVANDRAQFNPNKAKTPDERVKIQQQQDAAIQDAFKSALAERIAARQIKGEGLFEAFFQYEIRQVNNLVFDGVLRNNWIDPGGVKDSVYNFFAVAPVWLIWNHTVFFILFAALFLIAWAFFGGAISRIAAIHVARDEKIALRQALNFSFGKILSFASAPVIPLAIVIVIGLLVTVASLIGNIPWLGPLVVGALFIVALMAGAVMTLVLLGTAGGFNLMYPTIAVEGSDSFDAISRSFSYVYARPWRMLFYSVVALIYGAATYLFVHMFIWLTLVLTHKFVGMGIFYSADNNADLFSTMWPNPLDQGRLSYSPDYSALNPGARLGAFFMNCWVMFLVSILGAFAISLYFSANTIIYYLMRQEVDSTELDDVYLEQSEEEMEPTLVTASVTVATEGASTVDSSASPDSPA
jgi:hypothetical protein